MHAAQGPRRSQSVASMVSEVGADRAVHWVTATSAPCTSLFKPVLLEAGAPPVGPAPSDSYDDQSLWWRHERLHRALLADHAAGMVLIAAERDALEAGFRARIDAADDLKSAVASCWREAEAAEARWASALKPARPGGYAHARSWARLNQVAGMAS